MAGLPKYSATDPEPSDAQAGLIKSYADVDKPHNLPLSKCYWFLPIKGDPGILGGGLFPLLLDVLLHRCPFGQAIYSARDFKSRLFSLLSKTQAV